MHTPWSLFFLLPAAVCGCGFLFFVTEARQEQRYLADRTDASRAFLVRCALSATACCAATLVSLVPVLHYLVPGLAR